MMNDEFDIQRSSFIIHHSSLLFSVEEYRFVIIGSSESGKILVVAHTDDGELVRLISAREVTHGERESYEER